MDGRRRIELDRARLDRMGEEIWGELAIRQSGLLAHRQLAELGVGRNEIRHHLRVRRWARRSDAVVCTTTGEPTRQQRLWAAVLHAGPGAVLGGLTAAEVHGLTNWHREQITILVSNPLSHEPIDGVRFFRTRRPLIEIAANFSIPVARIEPAVLLFSAYQERNRRTAHGAVAAVVQQRLTNADRLTEWLELLKPLRGAAGLRALLNDISGGAQSMAEVDLRRACRKHRVALPRAQRPRFDRAGKRRYTDSEWLLADGRLLVLEVQGGFHDDVLQSADDKRRGRKLSTANRVVLACSAFELRYDAAEVMVDLIALGVPRA